MDKEQAKKNIMDFIKKRDYTYTLEQLTEIYLDYYKKGYYISFTSKDCVKHLEKELEIITA